MSLLVYFWALQLLLQPPNYIIFSQHFSGAGAAPSEPGPAGVARQRFALPHSHPFTARESGKAHFASWIGGNLKFCGLGPCYPNIT